MRWWCLMCKPGEQRTARRKLTEAGYTVRALECQGEPLTAYLFIRAEKPPTACQYIEGVLRLLPSVSAPVALSDADMAVLDEIERALNEAARHMPAPIDAAKAALANLLSQRFRVTVTSEPQPAGRNPASYRARRMMARQMPIAAP